MDPQNALRVTVEGDLPPEVLERIASAVQAAVRDEVASIDLLSQYSEVASKPLGTAPSPLREDVEDPFGVATMGIVYWPPEQ